MPSSGQLDVHVFLDTTVGNVAWLIRSLPHLCWVVSMLPLFSLCVQSCPECVTSSWWRVGSDCCRILLGRSLCGCVCWGTALMVSLWGLPGPDAPVEADFVYKDVVTSLVNHAQVLPSTYAISALCKDKSIHAGSCRMQSRKSVLGMCQHSVTLIFAQGRLQLRKAACS